MLHHSNIIYICLYISISIECNSVQVNYMIVSVVHATVTHDQSILSIIIIIINCASSNNNINCRTIVTKII